MNKKFWIGIAVAAFVVIAVFASIILPLQSLKDLQIKPNYDAGLMDRQIVYNGHIVEDQTQKDEVNNIVYADSHNLQVSVWPMTAIDADGKDIVQYVNFSYDGANAQNISWIFMYSGQLQNYHVGLLKTKTVNSLTQGIAYKNMTLEGVQNYVNLGSPTSACNVGTQSQNTKMYAVSFVNGTTLNYCFVKAYISSNTLEGYFIGDVETQTQVNYYDDVTNKVEYLGQNLLGNGRTFYKVDNSVFNPGTLRQTKWTYTPKNKALSGKWEIFAYSTNLGLQASLEQNKYLYIDPWWNTSLTYRRPINGTDSSFIMAANRSGNLGAGSDVDGDGGKEVLYSIPNKAYIYYNDDTDTFNANSSTELCLFDSFSNRSQCPRPSTGLVAYLPFDFNWKGIGNASASVHKVGTSTTGFSHPAGTVNNSYDSSETNTAGGGIRYEITDNSYVDFGTGSFAIIFDGFIPSTQTSATWFWTKNWYIWMNGAVNDRLEFYNGAIKLYGSTIDISDDKWRCFVIQRSGTNLSMWYNATLINWTTNSDNLDNANDVLLGYNNGGRDARMDDLYIFKGRALSKSEISDICNNRLLNYLGTQEQNQLVVVQQKSPSNAYISPQTNVTFNCTATHAVAVLSLNLTIDGSLNYSLTNSTPAQNLTFAQTVAMPDGSHTWFCSANSPSNSDTTSTRTLTVDTVYPSPALTAPDLIQNFGQNGTQLFVNWTVTDANLNNCLYTFAGVNHTVACNANTSIINITDFINKSVTFWANDTAGNLNHTTRSWDYKIFLESTNYASSIVEGSPVWFNLTLLTNSVNLASAVLNLSGTSYSANADQTGYNFSIYRQITAPSVSVDTNLSFFYNITRTDGFSYSFTPQNITVVNFAIDNCTVNNHTLYNFTIVDEAAQTFLNGTTENTTAEVDIQIYTNAGTLLENVSHLYTQINPFRICLSSDLSSGESYTIDTQVQYQASNYATEFYNILDATLDSNLLGTNITLYDLLSSDAQEFKITYKDENFLAVAGATIQVLRKYISEGVFKVVEIPLTDAQGSTLAHLVLSDVIYTFIVIKDNVILATFQNQLAKCNNVATGDCEIKLNEFASTSLPDSFSSGGAVSFNIAYDPTTKEVTSVYSITSGTPASTTLNVTLFDGLGTTQVCTDTLISAGGALTCTVPAAFENSTIVATLSTGGTYVGRAVIQQDDDPASKFGGSRVVLVILAFMILIGMGISDNPVLFGIFFIIGIIFLTLMNFISGASILGYGATAIWMIIAVVLVIIKIGRRQ